MNRVWKNFMGRGLVEAEDDLRETNPASNRELFDALAADFSKNKFDVKHLMRTILNSATYQRSSRPLPANAADDRFYSHYLIRRLPAERSLASAVSEIRADRAKRLEAATASEKAAVEPPAPPKAAVPVRGAIPASARSDGARQPALRSRRIPGAPMNPCRAGRRRKRDGHA